MEENQGCLTALLRPFGIRLTAPREESLPYRLRDDFLSAAELSFYRALITAAGSDLLVCPKVNLADVFFVSRPNENQAYRNKIYRKHVDYLLCDPVTMRPRVGVELDDRSHQRSDRQERDAFVESVFQAAGLPLLRVVAKSSYSVPDLAEQIRRQLGSAAAPVTSAPAPMPDTPAGHPVCPKCGVPMVRRTASRGERRGEPFLGCPNYPKCRETMPID